MPLRQLKTIITVNLLHSAQVVHLHRSASAEFAQHYFVTPGTSRVFHVCSAGELSGTEASGTYSIFRAYYDTKADGTRHSCLMGQQDLFASSAVFLLYSMSLYLAHHLCHNPNP